MSNVNLSGGCDHRRTAVSLSVVLWHIMGARAAPTKRMEYRNAHRAGSGHMMQWGYEIRRLLAWRKVRQNLLPRDPDELWPGPWVLALIVWLAVLIAYFFRGSQ